MSDPITVLAGQLYRLTGSPPCVSLRADRPLLGDYGAPHAGRAGDSPLGDGTILALEALGLLGRAEAAEWARLLELARRGWSVGPPADGDEVRLADDHLRGLIARLAEAADTASRSGLLAEIDSAYSLFLVTGLMRPEGAARWGARVEEALGRTVEQFELVEVAGVSADELDDWDGGPDEARGALLRVVPADLVRHDGLCVTAVALYERGFTVFWHAILERPSGLEAFEEFAGLEASDDLGTGYGRIIERTAGWSERDGPYAVFGEARCASAVPDAAAELRLSRGAAEWRVRLR